MTRASMAAEAAVLPRAPIAGIGRYHVGDEIVEFPVGWLDNDRDTAWARRQLARWGLAASCFVLVTAAAWQGPWVSPVLRAFREIGATFAVADVFGWDARRTATFARRLSLSMVFGLGGETAEALSDQGQLADLLRSVPAILAHADARPALFSAGLRPGMVAFLGPALALECPERSGAHVDGPNGWWRPSTVPCTSRPSARARTRHSGRRWGWPERCSPIPACVAAPTRGSASADSAGFPTRSARCTVRPHSGRRETGIAFSRPIRHNLPRILAS